MNEGKQPDDIAAQNERSLKTLSRAIALSPGKFSLTVARCNSARLRDRILEQLQARCEFPIRQIALSQSAKSLYAEILAAIGDEPPTALTVLGLESLTALDDFLTSTNQLRDEFRKDFLFPLVLWANDEVLQKLVRLAPDFYSWAGAPIQFSLGTEELTEFLQKEADNLFDRFLEAGAGGFAASEGENSSGDADKRFEIESAFKELQSRMALPPELEAMQQFLYASDALIENNMKRARLLFEQSLDFWQQSQNLERQACLLFHLGLWWRVSAIARRSQKKISSLRKARDCHQQCVEILQQANRADFAAKVSVHLAEILLELKQWDELEAVARSALQLQKNSPDLFTEASACGFLAEVALAKSQGNQAKEYAEGALQKIGEFFSSAGEGENRSRQSWYRLLLGLALQQGDRLLEARQHLETAKNECRHEENPLLYIRILQELRSLYFQQHRYRDAFKLKQEQQQVEHLYGLRAFIGAGRLQVKRSAANSERLLAGAVKFYARAAATGQATLAPELASSGRDRDVGLLIDKISRSDQKIIIIHAPSGAGKSSLIAAGLVPQLQELHAIEGRKILSLVVRFYTDWVGESAKVLAEALEPGETIRLSAAPASVEGLFAHLRNNANRNFLTVLIFDQFD